MLSSLVKCRWLVKMHHRHFKKCPRFCKKILQIWLHLSDTLMLWCMGITVVGTRDIGSLILLETCWPFSYVVISLSWIISRFLSWWRPLGLVLSDTPFVLILPKIPIVSLSLYFPPYHRIRCFCIPLMLDWRVLSCMILGCLGQESFVLSPLSLKRSMWLAL